MARGHDHESMPSPTHVLDHRTLTRTEFGVAKVPMIELLEVHFSCLSVVSTSMLSIIRTSTVRQFNRCKIAPKNGLRFT